MKKFIVFALVALIAVSVLFANGEKENSAAASTETAGARPASYKKGNTTWIVPSAAGGVTDTLSRAIVENLDLGDTVVIEDIPGGSQTIATTEFSIRPADGHTVIMMANAGLISQPLMNEVNYDISTFRYLSELAPESIAMVAVSPNSKLANAEDFINFIKNEKFNYGCANIGGYQHVAMCSALMQLGCVENATLVTYSGTQNVLQALLQGEVDFVLLDDDYVKNLMANGQIRVLLALFEGSSPIHPEIPGISTFGVKGMENMVAIKFLAVREETPDEIAEYIKMKVNEAVKSEGYQAFLEKSGFNRMTSFPTEEQIKVKIDSAVNMTRDVLKATGYID